MSNEISPENFATSEQRNEIRVEPPDTYVCDKDFRVQGALSDAQALQKLDTQPVGVVVLEVTTTVRTGRVIEAGRTREKWLQNLENVEDRAIKGEIKSFIWRACELSPSDQPKRGIKVRSTLSETE